jgi:hypothetical protein
VNEAVARAIALMSRGPRNATIQLQACKFIVEFAADAKFDNDVGKPRDVKILVLNGIEEMRSEAGRRNLRKLMK